ncbi:MAG: DUF6263 family protein [Weeksellaceae bacterium]|nr:DUF6263 family protein [Weeksellaceae bacterium]
MKKVISLLSILIIISSCNNQKNKEIKEINESGDSIENTQTGFSDSTQNLDKELQNTEENSSLLQNEDESFSFRYNLKKGENYPFYLKISTEQSMSAQGQSMNLSSSRTVDFDYFVESVEGNKFTLKATFKGFSESFKSPIGENISYNTNSAKPTNPDVAQSWSIYKSITGQTFTMIVDNKGKVLSVTGLDKVVNNAVEKLKTDFTPEEQKEIRSLLEMSLSQEAIRTQFEDSLNIFPDKSLKIGEKWEDTQKINEGPIKGENKVVRTFEGIQDGKAVITVKGTQSVNGSETQNGITATMKNTSTLNGRIELDLETGWIKKVSITKVEDMSNTYQQGERKETESGRQTITTIVN